MKHIKEYDEFINEAKSPVKIGDVLIHPDGRKGKVVKIMSDMANVDFGKGDVYGIMFRRIKGNQITENYDKRAYDSFTKYLQKNAASANLELFDPIPVGGSIFNKDYEKADNVLSFDWNIIDGKYTGSVKQKIDNFFKKAAAKFNMKPIHIQVGSVEFAPASPIKESSVNEGKSITAIQKEWAKTTTKMKELAQRFKAAEGDAKSKILNELKALTKRKKELERDLDDAVMSKGINQELSSVDEAKYKVNLKSDKLSSAEYQKAKKLKAFNPDDWKWNSDEDLYIKITK